MSALPVLALAQPLPGIAPAYDRAPTWRDLAACLGADTSAVFFPDNCDYRIAATYCNECPVVSDCLSEAVTTTTNNTDHLGYRGGTTERQRMKIRRNRDRRRR